MRQFIIRITGIFVMFVMIMSCSSDSGDTTGQQVKNEPPGKATLLFPFNNTECNEGNVLSATETEITFEWEDAANATSYELIIKNLNDNSARTLKTERNLFSVALLRATPYAWSVRSINSENDLSSDSETWKFYNSGLPQESHPPFPAEAVSPKSGASVAPGSVQLSWQASDIDNDIVSFNIILDNQFPPVTQVAQISVDHQEVTLNSGEVYYWKVITNDAYGNSSVSPIFQFKTN